MEKLYGLGKTPPLIPSQEGNAVPILLADGEDGDLFAPGQLIKDAIRGIFEQKVKKGDISKELFNYTQEHFDKAIDKGFGKVSYGEKNYDFVNELKHNTAVFNAFKNHHQTNEMVAALTDKDGNLRSFANFKKSTLGISKKYNQNYLRTEYNTAVRSSRMASEWKNIEANKDIFSFLEYLPSRSASPREAHKALWGVIKPVDDAFWNNHYPPNGWNCKCGVQPTRSDAGGKTIVEAEPAKVAGISGNSGKTGKVFTGSHPMVKSTSKAEKESIKNLSGKLEADFVKKEVLKWADKTKLYQKTFILKAGDEALQQSFTKTNLGSILYKPFKPEIPAMKAAKNRLIFDIDKVYKNATFLFWKREGKGRKKFNTWYYYEIDFMGGKAWLNFVKYEDGKVRLYQIADHPPIKK